MPSSLNSLVLATVLTLFTGVSSRVDAVEPPRKILFLGNSITQHGPKADIDWSGNWGMAASAEAKDYVHLVIEAVTTKDGVSPDVMVKNIADFERSYVDYDFAAKQREAIDFEPDLIILAIAENVPAVKSDGERKAFEVAVTRLLTALKGDREPSILVRSGFWANTEKDATLLAACRAVGGTFVDIGQLGKVEVNYARSERDFKHAGVANHPGDRGMAAIAAAIVTALESPAP